MKRFITVCVVGFLMCMSTPAFSEAEKASEVPNQFRIGIGGGVPYGGIGVNGEYRFNPYGSLTAGIGYYRKEAPGFAVGAIFYPLKSDGKVSPRLSGYFGRVSTWERTSWGVTTYRAIYGGALGAGFDWRIYKNLAFGLDLLYLLKDTPKGYSSGIGGTAGFGIVF